MKWNESIDIKANIETVWQLFDRNNVQRIMPQVKKIDRISYDETTKTAIYNETYVEGKREETYRLTEVIHEDSASTKHKSFDFVIAKTIHSEGAFKLIKIDEETTRFIYTGSNEGVSFFGKVMLKMAGKRPNDKVVHEFLWRVKEEAEKGL